MSGMYLNAGVIFEKDTDIRTATDPDHIVGIRFCGQGLGGSLSIQLGGPDQVAVADRLLAAVTEFHAEVHRRGHGGAVESNDSAEDNSRSCSGCGDQVATLSSRDLCDGCEADS